MVNTEKVTKAYLMVIERFIEFFVLDPVFLKVDSGLQRKRYSELVALLLRLQQHSKLQSRSLSEYSGRSKVLNVLYIQFRRKLKIALSECHVLSNS